ncbi:hypothetical protein [Microvirga rosea]|uniref:hypothetical protein n=1 Tax=Microvirga rosea TaxID=2715425 RepID=UPI001D0BC89B|nr:hypothetical protein [Microvirga rosea]MCB8822751.1 hypothetical protein [Microvirga rosea]
MPEPVELSPEIKGMREMTQQETLQPSVSSSRSDLEAAPPNLLGKIGYYIRKAARVLAEVFAEAIFEGVVRVSLFIVTRIVAMIIKVFAH